MVGKPRGILHARAHAENTVHGRVAPPEDLAPFIAHFWSVAWDLRGKPSFVAETLPHPCVHITVEGHRTLVGGVSTKRFSRTLRGRGSVFGIKFRPGMFQPWLRRSVSTLSNRVVSLKSIFGVASFAPDVDHAVAFLRARVPAHDPRAERVRDLVERMQRDPSLLRAEDVAELAGCTLRQLQRLFRTFVGATPKWVAKRYRLHEAAEQLASGGVMSLADLALRLGYFDQAHFVRDFKAVVGRAPGAFGAEHRH